MKSVNDSTATRVVCAILFLTFTFVFLYCYGGDMLVVEQHLASGGKTHYEYLIGAVLLTVFLWLVQVGAAALTHLRGIFHAVTYFPSMIILAFLVDTPSDLSARTDTSGWLWQLPLLLVLWGGAAWLARRYQRVEAQTRSDGLLSQLTFINVAVLVAFMLIPVLLANGDADFHHRVRQEYNLTHERPTEALAEGRQLPPTANQAMANAWCLFRMGVLPDSLFALPLPDGMTTLLPGKDNGHFLILPDSTVRRQGRCHRDVLLCGRLLARQLPAFSVRLAKWYGRRTNLPAHYREAVALCRQQKPSLVAEFPVEPTDTVLMDFQRLRHAGRQDSLRTLYGHTYWYYFYRK